MLTWIFALVLVADIACRALFTYAALEDPPSSDLINTDPVRHDRLTWMAIGGGFGAMSCVCYWLYLHYELTHFESLSPFILVMWLLPSVPASLIAWLPKRPDGTRRPFRVFLIA